MASTMSNAGGFENSLQAPFKHRQQVQCRNQAKPGLHDKSCWIQTGHSSPSGDGQRHGEPRTAGGLQERGGDEIPVLLAP